jgi:transposase
MQPVAIEVEETEQIIQRVAAIDVAKASGMVCTRLPHPTGAGRRLTRVWQVKATTRAILELADHLVCQGIERVVLESTSDYWRPFYYLLEARGLLVWLVNASQVKHAPGRPKSDKIDAVWLAKLNERSMLTPSFVPPIEIRRMRDWTRTRFDLVADRTRVKQRIEKLLEDALIKLSTVATDIFGVLRAGDAGSAHQRAAQPHGPGRVGPRPDAAQARPTGRSSRWPLQRPSRSSAAAIAGPA